MFYSIQFLRGIAALMVVMSHVAHKGQQFGTESLPWFHIGEDGVDLFFIISGFIMCFATHNKNISFLSFIKNRIERIIPLYWILSFLALIIYIFSPGSVNSSGGNTGIIESFFLIPTGNKFLIQNGWTLSYEFYYYFIFSFFILLTSFRKLRYLGIILSISALVFIGVIYEPNVHYLKFLTNALLVEFIFGIISFIFYRNVKPSKSIAILMILSGLSYLIYKNFHGAHEVMLGRTVTSGLPMFLIFLGFVSLESWFSSSKNIIFLTLEHLGNSSYSLYLVHPFIIGPSALILKKLNLLNGFVFTTFILVCSIVAGMMTYSLIEKPVARMLKLRGKNVVKNKKPAL